MSWFLPIGGYPSPAPDELAPPEPCAACKALEEKGKTCWRHKPADSIPVEEAITVTLGSPVAGGRYRICIIRTGGTGTIK